MGEFTKNELHLLIASFAGVFWIASAPDSPKELCKGNQHLLEIVLNVVWTAQFPSLKVSWKWEVVEDAESAVWNVKSAYYVHLQYLLRYNALLHHSIVRWILLSWWIENILKITFWKVFQRVKALILSVKYVWISLEEHIKRIWRNLRGSFF